MGKIIKQLNTIVKFSNIKINEPLNKYTYTRLGGKADYLVEPETIEEVRQIIKLANETKTPLVVLGNGSNIIFKDSGVRGIVLILKRLQAIKVNDNEVVAQSGALLSTVSAIARDNNLTGIEFACGIPGTIGGAVIMNAGAYGGEMKHVVKSVKVIDRTGELITKTAEQIQLDYRTSNIRKNNEIVVEATLQLHNGTFSVINEKMIDLTNKRNAKQPLDYPSCGSVFKRPPGYYAGKLIQDSNLQGMQIGGAEVSKKHAGFIVNKDGATSEQYISLIEYVQKTVYEKFNVKLEREVKIVDENGVEI